MFPKALFTAAIAVAGQIASAQQFSPGVGAQLQQIPPVVRPEKLAPDLIIERNKPPADTTTGGARIRVDALHVTGQTLYSEDELIAISGFVAGHDMNLGELRALAERITDFYNAHGYFLAQAYLPAQDIAHKQITIGVIEGRYGTVAIHNDSHFSSERAERMLSGIDSGDIVATAPLERRLLLLSDVPGVRVNSTLSPGTAAGTSDLAVDLGRAPAFDGSIEADNAGNRYTGTYRVGGTLNWNDPSGIGDQLSLRLLGSNSGLGYGRLAYVAPVGKVSLGAAYTHLRYDLGREFRSLDADGTADIASVFASYPLIRSRKLNLYLVGGIDRMQLRDDIGLVSSSSRRTNTRGSIGLSGDSRDRSGWSVFSASVGVGKLHFKDPVERADDAQSARSEGSFSKLEASAARLQRISGPFSLYAAIRGQIAFDNLDSSEKMELGGAYAVRAYPEGEAYGDQGYVATLEARLALDRWTTALPGRFQLIGFVDTGEVEYAHDPWFIGSNHSRRSGIGAGLDWAGPAGFNVRASYAHTLGSQPVTSGPDDSSRVWFQISKLF